VGGKANLLPELKKLVEDSNLPLYLQLKDIIKAQIISGAIQPGDRIPQKANCVKNMG